MALTVIDKGTSTVRQVPAQLMAVPEQTRHGWLECLSVHIRDLGNQMPHAEQLVASFPMITVPDQVPEPLDPHCNQVKSAMVSWSKPINASQSVLDMLDAHRDMPPVQDTRDRLTNRCSDQARECCFTPSLKTVTERPGCHPWSLSACRMAPSGETAPLAARAKRRGARSATSILPTVTSTCRV